MEHNENDSKKELKIFFTEKKSSQLRKSLQNVRKTLPGIYLTRD
jgi:hypothetical protein